MSFPGVEGLIFAGPAGFVGCAMLVWAISIREEPQGMSEKDISKWAPEAEALSPGAGGSVMYRVDTTLDEPVRTSILCGACGHLEWVEGIRPAQYACTECEIPLWEEEE